jgi:hypothetical protein
VAERLLADIPEEKRKECWWLVLRDGTTVAGDRGGGIAALLEMELTRPLGRVLHALRLGGLLDAIDTVFARLRKDIGKFVPDGPAPRRFP